MKTLTKLARLVAVVVIGVVTLVSAATIGATGGGVVAAVACLWAAFHIAAE